VRHYTGLENICPVFIQITYSLTAVQAKALVQIRILTRLLRQWKLDCDCDHYCHCVHHDCYYYIYDRCDFGCDGGDYNDHDTISATKRCGCCFCSFYECCFQTAACNLAWAPWSPLAAPFLLRGCRLGCVCQESERMEGQQGRVTMRRKHTCATETAYEAHSTPSCALWTIREDDMYNMYSPA